MQKFISNKLIDFLYFLFIDKIKQLINNFLLVFQYYLRYI